MKISVISGSHRVDSQSEKVARRVQQELQAQNICEENYLYSLADNPLPLWDEEVWEWDKSKRWAPLLTPIARQLESSDGFVIVSPEWHGMAPAGLKNFLLLWTRGEVAHKPALIVTVSVADGGSYPVAELRMNSYKNNRICYLPEHLIIRYVDTVFNSDASKNKPSAEEYFQERLVYCLRMLGEYSKAFRLIRASGACDRSVFKSGM